MSGPRKPQAFKLLAGTQRGDRPAPPAIEFAPVDELPEPPDWLGNAHAANEFRKLAGILFASRLLTPAGVAALGHLCCLHGAMVQLWAAGMQPNANQLLAYRAMANDFGLTPAAQGKVRASADKAQDNKFTPNGKRPA